MGGNFFVKPACPGLVQADVEGKCGGDAVEYCLIYFGGKGIFHIKVGHQMIPGVGEGNIVQKSLFCQGIGGIEQADKKEDKGKPWVNLEISGNFHGQLIISTGRVSQASVVPRNLWINAWFRACPDLWVIT